MKKGQRCLNCKPSRNKKCQNFTLAGQERVAAETQNVTAFPRDLSKSRVAIVPQATSLAVVSSPTSSSAKESSTSAIVLDESPDRELVREAGDGRDVDMGSLSSASVSGEKSNAEQMDLSVDPRRDASSSRDLPEYSNPAAYTAPWGEIDSATMLQQLNAAYAETVHWRRNIFSVPSGASGKEFVGELARLLQAFAEGSALESIALTTAMVMPALLLQKPHSKSKSKEHTECLRRRMTAWKEGDIEGLLREGRAIQSLLTSEGRRMKTNDDSNLRRFSTLMLNGNVRGAIRLLSEDRSKGVLTLSEAVGEKDQRTVREVLRAKHPDAAPIDPEAILPPDQESGVTTPFHPVLFHRLTGDLMRRMALRTEGAAGPSGIDAAGWRRLCTSFQAASDMLCNAVAGVAKRLCTSYVDPSILKAFTACRLIPLDKSPGVRPIGICEVMRRIIGKAVSRILANDIRAAAGPLQVCAGQPAGVEAAIHALCVRFGEDDCEGVLLVDATNAFNLLNRQVALRNIMALCPTIAPFLINIYRSPSELNVGGETMLSMEGTTQGDPLAMAMFAIATRPLIERVACAKADQIWFADDAGAGGKLTRLRTWWDLLAVHGPSFGYHLNPSKTWLLTKSEKRGEAERLFADTGVQITAEGVRHLGSALGSKEYQEKFYETKVGGWLAELKRLSSYAQAQPQLAYCALTQALAGKWSFGMRTAEGGLDALLQPLEDVLSERFIPALIGNSSPNDNMRALYGLPVRYGGLGIGQPVIMSPKEYQRSRKATASLVKVILEQHGKENPDLLAVLAEQSMALAELKKIKAKDQREQSDGLYNCLPRSLQRAVDHARETGASTWLTARPIKEHGFALHKCAFRDAVAMRYGLEPLNLPTHCVCGEAFNVAHALSCPRKGYIISRHNEIRDLTAELLSEVCTDVEVEPTLIPVGNHVLHSTAIKDDAARLDIKASGLWGGRFEQAFFDVRVFNPCASSNLASKPIVAFRRHENQKRNHYDQRIREVEMATFTPLVFSACGGMGPGATATVKRIASLLADKWAQPYSRLMCWLRCRYGFALIRASVMCLRGSRQRHTGLTRPDLALAEARVSNH